VLGVPEYHVEESGPDHQKSFRALVRVGGHVYGRGAGRSKKEAEQQAAEAAWNAINNGEAPLAGNGGGIAGPAQAGQGDGRPAAPRRAARPAKAGGEAEAGGEPGASPAD
jgi:ribonuclease-3